MSFQVDAQDVRVDEGHILRAKIRNGNSDLVDAEIDLNQCIGNSNGISSCPPAQRYRLHT